MRREQQTILVLAVTAFIAMALLLPRLVNAGDLEPSAAPGPTMHTLDEIYHRLDQLVPGGELAGVEKTGQTTSYATGDDGYWRAGVEWPVPRFTGNGDGTVTDNLTGLIWLQEANCFGRVTWANALSECNNLASGSCGLTDGSVAGDWRLPNVKELGSLVDYGEFSPAFPSGHPFTGVQPNNYWSSTTYAPMTDNKGAWMVSMYNGDVYYCLKIDNRFMWPVRGGN